MVEWRLDRKAEAHSVEVRLKNRKGITKWYKFDSGVFGLSLGMKAKKQLERHALVLVVGGVGDGKSTFVSGLAALDSQINGNILNMDDVAWSMTKFIQLLDSKDNKGRVIWGDEFIQAGGSRGMALTNIGNKLKVGFVTKRLKENTYILVADEPKEFPDKLIGMCDAMIHVKSLGVLRGYIDIYTNKWAINKIYELNKDLKLGWDHPMMKKIKPNKKGKFENWKDEFLDSEEFDRRKIEETRQMEEKGANGKDKEELRKKALALIDKGMKRTEVARELEITYNQLRGLI